MENVARVVEEIVGHVRSAVQEELAWLGGRPGEASLAVIEDRLSTVVARVREALLDGVASVVGTWMSNSTSSGRPRASACS